MNNTSLSFWHSISMPISTISVSLLWLIIISASYFWSSHNTQQDVQQYMSNHIMANEKTPNNIVNIFQEPLTTSDGLLSSIHHTNFRIHLIAFIFINMFSVLLLGMLRKSAFVLNAQKQCHYESMAEKNRTLQSQIQQNKHARKQLQNYATHDPLTGIYNRRRFIDSLSHEIKRYARYRSNFSILLIDLDHFKQINEQFGYECGDNVLISFAQHIEENLRASDIFARYDGKKFAIIATNTHLDSALRFAHKLIENVHQQEFIEQNKQIPLSVSIGVASPSLLTKATSEQLLSIAHDALDTAKLQGRDRVISAIKM